MGFILNTLLFLSALFLVLLVLVQRGRGGGLAGALGGMGGQSAFGTKAGDVFTRITICVAAAWIIFCALAVKYYRPNPEEAFSGVPSVSAPATTGAAAPAASPTGAPAATGAAPTATSPAP